MRERPKARHRLARIWALVRRNAEPFSGCRGKWLHNPDKPRANYSADLDLEAFFGAFLAFSAPETSFTFE